MSTIQPVGVFDSGVGGLSVARGLLRDLPNEPLLYYADTAHVPYGGRPLDEVRGFALHICDFLIGHGAKMVIMACNISSAVAIDAAREHYPTTPIIGVVRPGAKAAVQTGAERIGVLATQGTVSSGAYDRAIHEADKGIGVVQVACPQFVPLVEAGDTDGDAAYDACREALLPLAKHSCDAIILGCTHYPFLLPMLQRCADELFEHSPAFIDPAGETIRLAGATLRESSLAATASGTAPNHRYFASGDPVAFQAQAPLLLGFPVISVEKGY